MNDKRGQQTPPTSETGFLPVDEHEEEFLEAGRPIRRKGIYLLPNLFTSGNLFCGFYAVIAAQLGNFSYACIAVFVAIILDSLDGRIARLTNTTSKFGEQYDSLADMLTFGLSPAMVVYCWSLKFLGKLGWIVAFIYTACTALRLARFNTQINTTNPRYFTGLPSPSAAGLLVSMVWAFSEFGIEGKLFSIGCISAFFTALSGILMVSNIQYSSGKQIDLRGRVHFIFGIVMVLGLTILVSDPSRILFCLFLIYSLSGLSVALWKFFKRFKKSKNKLKHT